jgi:NAD(P)-dependent dehydrogenase (short-subunit alcohol dehydrogenase family)
MLTMMESVDSATARTAIVTGGGTGIGLGVTAVLAEAGINCVIAGRRTEPLEQTASHLERLTGAVVPFATDVTDDGDRLALISHAVERFGHVDILINNAGGAGHEPLMDSSASRWREVLEVNLTSVFMMSQAVLPHMKARGFGRIVNVGSIMGLRGGDGTPVPEGLLETDRGPMRAPAYHAAKAGVANLTRDLAAAVARWGVTVNTVTPGFIERPGQPRPAKVLDQIAARVPIGRAGSPTDVAYAVRYLVSDEASYVTGAELVVDGGRSAW